MADKGWLTKLERPGKSSVLPWNTQGVVYTTTRGSLRRPEGVVQATPNYTNELHQGSVSKKCVDCGKPADINPFTGEPNPRCRSVTAHKEPKQDPRFQAATYRVWQPEEALMTRLMLGVEVANIRRRLQSVLTASWTKKSNQYPTTADRLSQALSAPLTAKGTVCD